MPGSGEWREWFHAIIRLTTSIGEVPSLVAGVEQFSPNNLTMTKRRGEIFLKVTKTI